MENHETALYVPCKPVPETLINHLLDLPAARRGCANRRFRNELLSFASGLAKVGALYMCIPPVPAKCAITHGGF